MRCTVFVPHPVLFATQAFRLGCSCGIGLEVLLSEALLVITLSIRHGKILTPRRFLASPPANPPVL